MLFMLRWIEMEVHVLAFANCTELRQAELRMRTVHARKVRCDDAL
jgi:hypothetical protein